MCVARDFGPCCGLALWTLSIWALVIRPMAPPAINVVVEALEFPPEFWIVEIDGVPARISLLVPAIWPRARPVKLHKSLLVGQRPFRPRLLLVLVS